MILSMCLNIQRSHMQRLVNGSRVAVYARAESSLPAVDVFKESKKSGSLITASAGNMVVKVNDGETGDQSLVPLDFKTWLPFAAGGYHISSDPSDYVLVPVIIMPSDLPNRNGVAFPLKELVRFNHELGMQAYKTWKGKPTYREHKNDDITQAHGVIADVVMRKLTGFGGGKLWKVLNLLAFDRSKHPDLVAKILSGEENAYSMGAWVNTYRCSLCDAEVGNCGHIAKKGPGSLMHERGGSLVYKNCEGIEGFETSSVGTPAYISAISDTKHTLFERPGGHVPQGDRLYT